MADSRTHRCHGHAERRCEARDAADRRGVPAVDAEPGQRDVAERGADVDGGALAADCEARADSQNDAGGETARMMVGQSGEAVGRAAQKTHPTSLVIEVLRVKNS